MKTTHPQWATSSRLLKLGEAIQFHFYLPAGAQTEDLTIYPRYLELAQPGERFVPGGGLEWLDELESETIALSFDAGKASVTYTPDRAGSYLARWRAGDKVLYRYFSVIEDDWIVLRFSTFNGLEAEPTLHATGIPLDYRLPAERFEQDDSLFEKFLGFHRHFGDTIVPLLPDTPNTSREERLRCYGDKLEKARSAVPFPEELRSARVEMHHESDPGYTETLSELGINDHCGLNEANAPPWLGMPEFPYFASDVDCRKVHQSEGGAVVAHQWDFCGGWHFLGPVSWHYKVSEGDWSLTEPCLREGLDEFRNLIQFSNHPAFALPLYDGVVNASYPNPNFQCILEADDASRHMPGFVELYQRFMAFEVPKEYKVVYARSIDVADYYRRHFKVTPRTIFVSKTEHVMYDMWWLCHWCNDRILIPRERIPRETRISTVMSQRVGRYFKDPLSFEYIQFEDHLRSFRFERESPNPIWWFDYRRQERGQNGSAITHTETPDVEVLHSNWERKDQGLSRMVKMKTEASFPDYAITLWDLPAEFDGATENIRTNAKEHALVWNRDGEFHLILVFDLAPDVELEVTILAATGGCGKI